MPDGVVDVGERAVRADVSREPGGEAATRPALQLCDMHRCCVCIRIWDARVHLKDLCICGGGQRCRSRSGCRGVALLYQQLGCRCVAAATMRWMVT